MTQMTAEDFDKKFEEKSEGWLKKIMKAVRGIKMITVTTADGTLLDFGEDITEESQIQVGSTATVDGSPASGEYVLNDGRTLVFENGAVTEIVESEEEETMEDLKKQLADKIRRLLI